VAEDRERKVPDELRGAKIRVLGTDPDNPDDGRIFVWTKVGWFEREEGPSGDAAFTPVAKSEDELREYILRDNPSADLVQIGGEFRKNVSEKFMEQALMPTDQSEDSDEDSFHDDEDDQQYHQHDND
jgi:hypothetical protein